MRIRHRLLLHLSCPSKATKRLLKTPHVDEYCGHVFYKWPLNAVLHKKLSLQSFRRKYCKDGAKTYDFIADKCCLLFSIILKVLHGWEVIRTQGKILTVLSKSHSSEGQLLKFNRLYEIVVVWAGGGGGGGGSSGNAHKFRATVSVKR